MSCTTAWTHAIYHQEPLRLFALEPVDVCLLSQVSQPQNDAHPEGWAELEYTEAPEVEGFEKDGDRSGTPEAFGSRLALETLRHSMAL